VCYSSSSKEELKARYMPAPVKGILKTKNRKEAFDKWNQESNSVRPETKNIAENERLNIIDC
tara:strand:- start:68 stop:253 length:186 start_codon:yes stop_codon:yes gene_type:complete